MSATNSTPNLGLSQYKVDDNLATLTDYNNDMLKIDAAVKELQDNKLDKPNGTASQLIAGDGSLITPDTTPLQSSTKPITAGAVYENLTKHRFIGEFRQSNRDAVYNFNEIITARDALMININAFNKGPFNIQNIICPFGGTAGPAYFGNLILLHESNHYSGIWSKRLWFLTSSTNIKLDTIQTDDFSDISVNIWLIKNWRGV